MKKENKKLKLKKLQKRGRQFLMDNAQQRFSHEVTTSGVLLTVQSNLSSKNVLSSTELVAAVFLALINWVVCFDRRTCAWIFLVGSKLEFEISVILVYLFIY